MMTQATKSKDKLFLLVLYIATLGLAQGLIHMRRHIQLSESIDLQRGLSLSIPIGPWWSKPRIWSMPQQGFLASIQSDMYVRERHAATLICRHRHFDSTTSLMDEFIQHQQSRQADFIDNGTLDLHNFIIQWHHIRTRDQYDILYAVLSISPLEALEIQITTVYDEKLAHRILNAISNSIEYRPEVSTDNPGLTLHQPGDPTHPRKELYVTAI